MKFFKRVLKILLCLGAAVLLVRFGPAVYERFFGMGDTVWLSQKLSEALIEKNQLVVYEIETTGQDTVSQDAWLIGTVQKVQIPYTFQMQYTVDLSLARVSAQGNRIELRVPPPEASYHKLIVDEANVKKKDWLYRLTPERYAEICGEIENRLFSEYSAQDSYRASAWDVTVRNLEQLFRSLQSAEGTGSRAEIRIVRDDTLTKEIRDEDAAK